MDKLALIFPGQGSQKRGMGKELCTHFPVASRIFEEASDILDLDMKKLCFETSASELTKTENAQPAILTLSVAKYRVYHQEIGITPSFSAGHSLGEYSALVCSGSIRFRDAVKIVRKRGELMSRSLNGKMAAVSGLEAEEVKKTCRNITDKGTTVVAANFNSSKQIVISGINEGVIKASEELSLKGGAITPLRVSAAFHSPLMHEAADEFREEISKYEFSFPGWAVISNCTSRAYRNSREIPQKLVEQITSPVLWHQSVNFMINAGVNTFLELGPGSTLNNLLKKEFSNLKLYSSSTREDLMNLQELKPENFKASIPGIPERCLAMAVCTKNRNSSLSEYQELVLPCFRELKELCFRLKDKDLEPDKDTMDRSLELLQSIFAGKQVPAEEQNRRLIRVVDETQTSHLYPRYSALKESE